MKKNIKRIDNRAFNDALKKVWSPGKFNPNGSYTGVSYDYKSGYEYEKTNDTKADAFGMPVQDADDL